MGCLSVRMLRRVGAFLAQEHFHVRCASSVWRLGRRFSCTAVAAMHGSTSASVSGVSSSVALGRCWLHYVDTASASESSVSFASKEALKQAHKQTAHAWQARQVREQTSK